MVMYGYVILSRGTVRLCQMACGSGKVGLGIEVYYPVSLWFCQVTHSNAKVAYNHLRLRFSGESSNVVLVVFDKVLL